MPRKVFLWVVVLLLVFTVSAFAKGKKFKHADKNKDGTIDRKEWKMEKKWEHKQKTKVNTWWEKRADTNNDGVVDAGELSAWKKLKRERIDLNNDGVIDAKERRLCWRNAKSKVNTAVEQKYDANGDGWLEESEVRQMLRDRHQLVKTKGKAKVDSAIEAEYDINSNGIIDQEEAQAMKEDLK